MIGPDLDKLIKKLQEGKCSEEELDKIFQAVKQLPPEQGEQLMDELWENVREYPRLKQALSEKMYAGILSRIPEAQARKEKAGSSTPRIYPRRRLLKLAGLAAALLALISVAIWLFQDRQLSYHTAYADRQTITLPDGSVVTLNANSSLQFKAHWNEAENRQVWLKGEAFFEVAKKPASGQKFQVITPDLTVEVLGTVFNVSNREAYTRVFLEEGKVALKLKDHPGSDRTMEPGELLTYSAEQKAILENAKNTTALVHTSWKDGVLTFESTPLLNVLRKVEEIYGVRFEVKTEEDLQREISTGLPMEALDLVIPMLEQALDLQIRQEGDHFIVE